MVSFWKSRMSALEGGEYALARKRLAFENRECGAYEAVSFGRIEEGGVDYAVGDGTDAYVGGCVDTYYLYVVAAEAACDLGGAYGHAVVVGIDEVYVGTGAEQGIECSGCVVLVPVAYDGAYEVAACGCELLCEAGVARFGG